MSEYCKHIWEHDEQLLMWHCGCGEEISESVHAETASLKADIQKLAKRFIMPINVSTVDDRYDGFVCGFCSELERTIEKIAHDAACPFNPCKEE